MVSTRQMSIGNSTSEAIQVNGKFTRSCAQQPLANIAGWAVSCAGPSKPQLPLVTLLDLPDEIIEKILGYLPFKTICQLRLVCQRINAICGHMLNSNFQRLLTLSLQQFHDIKAKMPRRESARRQHPLALESDIIETIHMRLTLLHMSFGKHIDRNHCCFFPGQILDEVHQIFRYIKTTPKIDLPYRVTDELFDLSTMAMEYFKEKIEPNLPEIGVGEYLQNYKSSLLFGKPCSSKYSNDTPSESAHQDDDSEDLVEIMPQSNMVLRKGIRKIKQGMKRYNNQLSNLKMDLRTCKKKLGDQQRVVGDLQKQKADHQKQMMEYATRLDEYDKKNEVISRKFSTVLQELNKCKTELQYWRSKSPAVTCCSNCGNDILPPQPVELEALINHEDVLHMEEPVLSDSPPEIQEEGLKQTEPVTSALQHKKTKRKLDEADEAGKKTRRFSNVKRKSKVKV